MPPDALYLLDIRLGDHARAVVALLNECREVINRSALQCFGERVAYRPVGS
jgi:hypothetical protein